jgi:hypothetical protein
MLTRHRYLTRWPRRLAFALLLTAAWYGWRAWQTAKQPREPAGQLATSFTFETRRKNS